MPPPKGTPSALTHPSRLEGLSDATFAIVLTLLVLETRRPSTAQGHLAHGLAREWPSCAAYVMAFFLTGVLAEEPTAMAAR